jgi:hypothetical protein
MLSRFFRRPAPDLPAPPPVRTNALPPYLVQAVQTVSVIKRNEADPETGEERVIVSLPNVGTFAWSGIEPAAEKFARAWPELSDAAAQRAAQLLGAELAALDRAGRRRGRRRRNSWVWGWADDAEG